MAEKIITRRHVIARLITDAIYSDDEAPWRILTDETASLATYFDEMGLKLVVDTEMGMGYLRPLNQQEEEEIAAAGQAPIPKVIPPKALGYHASLMCALLRQALQLHEENSTDSKYLYQDENQLIELLRPYMAETQDEKALNREVRRVIKRLEEIGVIHQLLNRSETIYRVEPIIRARIPIAQLQELLIRLKEYSTGTGEEPDAADGEAPTPPPP
jgi:hypothetical protein